MAGDKEKKPKAAAKKAAPKADAAEKKVEAKAEKKHEAHESKAEHKEHKKAEAKAAKAAKAGKHHVEEEHKPHDKMACKVGGCKRAYRAKGYCKPHYRKWRHGAFGKKRYKTCSALNCFRAMVVNRHGYCEEHFQQYYIKGDKPAAAPAPAKEEKAGAEKGAA